MNALEHNAEPRPGPECSSELANPGPAPVSRAAVGPALRMGDILGFRFGNFEIDAARQELRRAGEAVHIEPQVFDLLVHLVQNRDRIVSKDELIETIWRGRIISEAALSSCISAARRALDDNGNDQALVRTLHKRGFRFVGDVDEGSSLAAIAAARSAFDPGCRSRRGG